MSDRPTRCFDGIEAELAERGLSIREAARQAGVHEASFRRLLAGGGVRPATAKKIADLLEVRVRDLLDSVATDAQAAA